MSQAPVAFVRSAALSLALFGLCTAAAMTAAAQPAFGQGIRTSESTPASAGDPLVDPVSVQGQQARGLYVTGPYAQMHGAAGIVRLVRRNRLDAVVIDVKDGQGRVGHDSAIPELQEQEHGFLGDARALITAVKAEGIYTIARVVCFSDPLMPLRMPERAIQDNRPRRGNRPWVSWGTGHTWLDPYNVQNHDMIVALTREVEAMGFDEVQLDYIRFPVDDGIPYAHFPAENDKPRWQVLHELLERIDRSIRIPLGVDVFGLTAFNFGNPHILGQVLERWTDVVEVITPMLYLHAMRGWGGGDPARVAGLISTGTGQLRERLGPIPIIRPFLQSFPNTITPVPAVIADQIRGARQGNSDGFLFWHPGSRFTFLQRGMNGPARNERPFPLEGRDEARARFWASPRAERGERPPRNPGRGER